jgi:serine/threonine protein kinase
VKDNLECCLSDFGIAVIHETHTLASESVPLKGSERWMAPEIISQGFGLSATNTPARDIYAFGCTILQVSVLSLIGPTVATIPERKIFTGKAPFSNVKYNVQVINSVIAGLRPERPRDEEYCDELWTLTQQCWHQDATLRPAAADVAKSLAILVSKYRPRPRPKPRTQPMAAHHRRLAHTFRLRVGNAAELRAYLLSSDSPWEGFESLDDCYVGAAIEFLQTVSPSHVVIFCSCSLGTG